MVYSTGNGASLQKLLDKNTNFRKKIMNIILYEIKKKERKTLNTFQKLLKLLE